MGGGLRDGGGEIALPKNEAVLRRAGPPHLSHKGSDLPEMRMCSPTSLALSPPLHRPVLVPLCTASCAYEE